ncbi:MULTISPECIES: formate C-acetyltransferase [unclassified Clostridioides]|uniref:formate C-acetyltransferase n=1 Tax=unclassified Clostridioides TaxID=2635829 RepID=UPI001D0FC29E|nr:formate C-acetyltransferase [Clostridioides sp. ZZV15-6388]MCC0661462.1 formate C-acetyltransferase [Clostridioides sp. ZZV14-6154]MCC0663658.1 formate C-acetyltransferase [Clostridioides sp. ZZV15-6597]MCC0717912.1 formate C-acetyltransferase [Clostridioides sp. ZZV14-6105]MCC0725973.1 formate C-acetyltransferase [Clostridioides sp. ZZV14-6045]MCC0735180.1 formate C-acetyltransferase [Clostridioides sp. ZZV14-6009]MCC0738960.1 formate C-acetyltransferase [Clostridioides sp. ZZV14-5902]WL
MNAWQGFKTGRWTKEVNVREFIQLNYSPYEGNDSFLAGATENTKKLWDKAMVLFKKERENGGTLDVDTKTISGIAAYAPGYLDKVLETIVGLQTDAPLKRAVMPYGGIKMVENSCDAFGYELDPEIKEIFTKYRKTHNQGVFDAYTPEMRAARKSGIITGLPDAYGRGRIIGDYRRVALYGVDALIEDKIEQKKSLEVSCMDEEVIRLREEITEQISALNELKKMAESYGFDISKPATNSKEAVQWLYFGYLAAVKDQNGAAMSLGRTSTFLDIYFERDLKAGTVTEEELQEYMDHFVMKLRMVKFLRTPDYNNLFSGDPTWVTECIGGMGVDGRTLVTKNSFRMLNTLYTLGPSPEPNLTVLWSTKLPQGFKDFCSKVSIDTSSVQYENDDLMRPYWGDDYGIACCVSAMKIGKQMQFFGARVNLAKTLLYAINGGIDEKSGAQVGPRFEPITSEYLDFDEVMSKFEPFTDWLANLYVNTLNVIHYMHDKYSYEALEMALHDRDIFRTMACGMAGLSVCADSLSAIKHAKVKTIRNEQGIAVDFEIEGDYPKYGNNDDRVDSIAVELVESFMNKIRKNKTYRNSYPTQSILTITSNVVYGKKTGNTPDGRRAGAPFAPGANPMHGRDTNGALASLSSVAKLPYEHAQDGISNTFSIVPGALGKDMAERINNLSAMMDGYFAQNAHHLNVNVFDRATLEDAMEHPEEYPQLTIRVSGYAVNFIKLTKEQQLDVINRTFHGKMA